MAKMMLYNGVEFPELPVYDESTYRYALIVGESLYMFEVEPVVSGGMASVTAEACGYYVRNNTWLQNTFPTLSQTWNFSKENIVWVNFNLLNSDGTIYLAASTPVDPNAPTFTPADFLRWFSLGQAAGLKLKPTGDPAAYLYNGVQLPDIYTVYTPDVQKTHPYACIFYTLGRHVLDLWPVKPIVNDDPDSSIDSYGPNGETAIVRYCNCRSGDVQWGGFSESSYSSPDIRIAPFWTNTDLYTTDGNLYLAASDPVPVYE